MSFTAEIERRDDVSLREFAWNCARAFFHHHEIPSEESVAAAEDASDAPGAPDPFLESMRANLAETEALTPEQADALAWAEHEAALIKFHETKVRYEALVARYDRVRKLVKAWTPPTSNHKELKAFMLAQIDEGSAPYRSWLAERREPRRASAEQYVAETVDVFRRIIENREKFVERHNRTKPHDTREWLRALRESVGERPEEKEAGASWLRPEEPR